MPDSESRLFAAPALAGQMFALQEKNGARQIDCESVMGMASFLKLSSKQNLPGARYFCMDCPIVSNRIGQSQGREKVEKGEKSIGREKSRLLKEGVVPLTEKGTNDDTEKGGSLSLSKKA